MSSGSGLFPGIGGRSVSDQKDPRATLRDTILQTELDQAWHPYWSPPLCFGFIRSSGGENLRLVGKGLTFLSAYGGSGGGG